MYIEENNGIVIKITPKYLPEKSIPEQKHYFFSYKVEIENNSSDVYKLKRRRWFIKNGKGIKREVEGRGVVGKEPVLEPGDSFSYTSYCPLDTPTGNMRGSYVLESISDNLVIMPKTPLFFFRTDL